MGPVASRVDSVRQYLEKRIERCSIRIKRAKKSAAARPQRRAPRRPQIKPDMAARRAYRDALRALGGIPSDVGAREARRLAALEVDRVKSALARIYEVTQHANHDIVDAGDWAIVEGEAQGALNVLREAERDR